MINSENGTEQWQVLLGGENLLHLEVSVSTESPLPVCERGFKFVPREISMIFGSHRVSSICCEELMAEDLISSG